MTIVEKGKTGEIYNIAGGFEQSNIDTVYKIIKNYYPDLSIKDLDKYIDLSLTRPGQDVRYALDDTKLRKLNWSPKRNFDLEIKNIVDYYKNTFIW
jgi:dTDP-D-glucose 4,6-dehydratase